MQFSDVGVVTPRLGHVYCQRISSHKNPPAESGDGEGHSHGSELKHINNSQRGLLLRPGERQ